MNKKIAIIGSGALGTSLAKILVDAKNENIIIYGIDQGELNDLKNGCNSKYFPNIKLPKFNVTSSLDIALKNAEYVVIAIPSVVISQVFKIILQNLSSQVLIINGSKGFYPNSDMLLHEGLLNDAKGNKNIRGVVSLIGPSHAREMVLEKPTLILAVNADLKLCFEVQKLFANHYFRVYGQTDEIGAEVGSAYKNVIAIASGIAAGCGYGINTTAALLTRGIAEMQRFNKFRGGQMETLLGLSGIGDLIVTATSDLSRNFSYGKKVAESNFTNFETTQTVEGLTALKFIYKIGKEHDLNLPIVNELYKLLIEKKYHKKSLINFWNRDLIQE